MKKLWGRITADTPAFFKRVINTGIVIGVTCTGILVGISQAGIEPPPIVSEICQIGIAVGIVMAAIAKTAKEDKTK